MIKNIPKHLCVVFLASFICNSTIAATFTANATGNWNVDTKWTLVSGADADGVPDDDDIATIPTGITMSTNGDRDILSLTIEGTLSLSGNNNDLNVQGGGSLILNTGGQITDGASSTAINFVDNSSSYTFTNNGTIAADYLDFEGSSINIAISGNGRLTVGEMRPNNTGITITLNTSSTFESNVSDLLIDVDNFTISGTGTLGLSSKEIDIQADNCSIGCIVNAASIKIDGNNLDLTLTSGANVTLTDDFEVGETSNSNSVTVTINSNAAISVADDLEIADGANANTFAVNNSGTTTVSGDIELNNANSVSFTNSGTFTCVGSMTNAVGGGSAPTFTNNTNAIFYLGGDMDNDFVLSAVATNNTVNYNSNGGTDIEDPTGNNYYHIIIGGTSNRLLRDNISVAGNLTIQNTAILNSNSMDITIAGNWTNTSTNADPFVEGTRTVTFSNSAAAQTITNTGDAQGTQFYNLVTNNTYGTSPQFSLSGNVIAGGTLTMTAGVIDGNSNSITVGTSTGSIGTLSHSESSSAGWLYDGTFTRYLNTSTISNNSVTGLFPVGHTADLRPLYLSAPTTAPTTGGSVSVSHVNVAGVTTVSIVDGVTTIEARREVAWPVSTSGLSGGDYNLRIGGTGIGYIEDVNDLRSMLATSTVGTAGTNAGTTTNPQVKRTGLTAANLTNTFYIGTVNSSTSPLPVELVSFDAQYANKQVEISWETASEINNDYFKVEKSQNAIDYTEVGIYDIEDREANSSTSKSYVLTDVSPYVGLSYYRLIQVDLNGVSETFDPVTVDCPEEAGTAVFDLISTVADYENQTVKITFNNETTGKVRLLLYNQSGQLVAERTCDATTGSNSQELSCSSVKNGIYYFALVNAKQSISSTIYLK